jgi:hypothetical protein
MPVPSEWELEGDRLVLRNIKMVRVDIEDMYSIETLRYDMLEAMSEYDKWETEEH